MKTRLKKVVKVSLAICGALALVAGALFGYLTYADSQHEKFYRSGRSINEFLSAYGQALLTAFKNKDLYEVSCLYSVNYYSPSRGRWLLR